MALSENSRHVLVAHISQLRSRIDFERGRASMARTEQEKARFKTAIKYFTDEYTAIAQDLVEDASEPVDIPALSGEGDE